MHKAGRIGAMVGATALGAVAAAAAVTASPAPALTKFQSGEVCLGWRPHGPQGGAILAGSRCDRPAVFQGSPQRPRPVTGFEGAPVPPGATTTVPGWTPMRVSADAAGAVRLLSPPDWPALGAAASSVGSCLTLHRQTGGGAAGALTADILPCEPGADDQLFDLRPGKGRGSRIVSRQGLESGPVCLTRPVRPGPPATFTRCSDDPAQAFVLKPAPSLTAAPNHR
jgi:hypothetical protein